MVRSAFGSWRAWVSAGLLACAALVLPAHAAPVKTDHVTAELVAERSAVQPGESLQIGLRLQHIPHWHTYWRNPGDSGLPTTIEWTLPAGARTGSIEWPAPQRLPIGPLVNYGYEGDLLLPMRFTAPADAAPGGTLTVRAKASWLVCKDVCIPESASLDLALPVVASGTTPGSTAHLPRFERAEAEQPVPLRGWAVRARTAGQDVLLTLEPESADAAAIAALPPVEVFPFVEQVLEPARHETWRTQAGYAVRLRLLDGMSLPGTLEGIAVLRDAGAQPWGGPQRAAEFSATVEKVDAVALPPDAVRLDSPFAARQTPVALGGGADLGLWAALALAFVGGLVLNLMPCVFPVLSIKLLSLAQPSAAPAHAPPRLRAHALAYTSGVVLSFLALASALLALRAAGSAIGWGFQLQEPGVVFVLALLFFLIGLNLIGAFEFAALVPQRLAVWRSERPAADAFAAGVLAVVAATPCTAPFMGAALGFAVTQSTPVGLAVFAVLGLGMALPYALLVLLPGWRAKLPRPGAWMLRLKQMLAFPMFATVVWLVWVLGQQAGIDGAAMALMALVGVAFVSWWAALPMARRPAGRLAGAAALIAVLAWAWPQATPPGEAGKPGGHAASAAEAAWQPYDEAEISRRLAEGQPVFVDFTAAWCVSCQVNKRLVLHTDDTQAAFAKANVALMRADWTHRDERITSALQRLGRNGVPVYLLMRPGREPLLLPEVLTGGVVRDALATLSSPS